MNVELSRIGNEPIPMPQVGQSEEIYKEYVPKRQDLLREHNVNIEFFSVGCVIRVGCKSIPFTNVDDAMVHLQAYVKNPHEEIKKWNEIFNKQ